MTLVDYLLNGALVALILLQVRGRRLGVRAMLLPLAVVVVVAVKFIHQIPTAGNDLALILAGSITGLALGAGCGLATSMYRGTDGRTMIRAGVLAVLLWVAGIGARMTFAIYASHGGAAAIGRFSVAHDITSGQAWVDCLVLMALLEVVSRTAVLAVKYLALRSSNSGAPGTVTAPIS